MALTDDERQTLRTSLADHLDEDTATLVLEALPPMDFDDLATKGDLSRVETDIGVLKTDMAEVKTDVAVLKTDVAVLKTDVAVLKTDMAEVKTDVAVLKTDMAEVKGGVAANRAAIIACEGALRQELALGLIAVGARIDEQGARLDSRIDGLNTRLDSFGREQRQLVFGAVGVMLGALVALAAFIVNFG